MGCWNFLSSYQSYQILKKNFKNYSTIHNTPHITTYNFKEYPQPPLFGSP